MKITAAQFIFSIFLSCSNRQDNENTVSGTKEINATSAIISTNDAVAQAGITENAILDELPSGVPIVLGQWGVRDNMNFRYFFWPDNRWYERYFAGEAAHGGTWELAGNILTLRRAAIWLRVPDEGEGEALTIELSIIDQSNIDLRFDENRIVGLTRIER